MWWWRSCRGAVSCLFPADGRRSLSIPTSRVLGAAQAALCTVMLLICYLINAVYSTRRQAPLRLWNTTACCFNETFMKIDLAWDYSESETFVPDWGEAFGSRWWRKGALCRWVAVGLPGLSWLCQVAQDGCGMEEIPLLKMLLRLSEKLRSFCSWGCGRAASMLSAGQAALVKGNQFPL